MTTWGMGISGRRFQELTSDGNAAPDLVGCAVPGDVDRSRIASCCLFSCWFLCEKYHCYLDCCSEIKQTCQINFNRMKQIIPELTSLK